LRADKHKAEKHTLSRLSIENTTPELYKIETCALDLVFSGHILSERGKSAEGVLREYEQRSGLRIDTASPDPAT